MYIKDWCEKVGNILSSLKFISTETIEVIKSADGYQFIVKNLSTEASSSFTPYTYTGYFSVTNTSDNEITKVNISEGRCRINIYDFYISAIEMQITSSGYIYLNTTMNQDGVVATPSIKFYEITGEDDTPPVYADNTLNQYQTVFYQV